MEPSPPPSPARAGQVRPGRLALDDYVIGIVRGDRAVLGRAITLIESTSAQHEAQAQELLTRLRPHTRDARRVGITGIPGVGKSTFIESLGCHLCQTGHHVAVLAIDPTSVLSRGSILGDKTRMERLSGEPNAFIRPSPSGATPGGVARRTRETILLLEAAGFDVVLVETVGVGQGEIALRSMVDFFLLLLLPGAGDELQGIKRGVMEMADAVLINKADGPNRQRAEAARSEQAMALHCLQSPTPKWQTVVSLCAGLTGEGIPEFWQTVERFYAELGPAGIITERRQDQLLQWFQDFLHEELITRLHREPAVQLMLPDLRDAVRQGELTPVRAARALLEAYDKHPARRPGGAEADPAGEKERGHRPAAARQSPAAGERGTEPAPGAEPPSEPFPPSVPRHP
jgi:LAO/AO transport system kinase